MKSPTVNGNRVYAGEVAEWLKAPLSKSGILLTTGSWVRIPPSPPEIEDAFQMESDSLDTLPKSDQRLPQYFRKRTESDFTSICSFYGEMTELAEGARLEIVCAVKGTEGSNPSLSAML